MVNKWNWKKIAEYGVAAVVAALFSQAGLAMCSLAGHAVNIPSLKSTALMFLVAITVTGVIWLIRDVVLTSAQREKATAAGIAFSLFCDLVIMQSLCFPLTSVNEPELLYFRYSSLAPILSFTILAVLRINGRKQKSRILFAAFLVSFSLSAICMLLHFKGNTIFYFCGVLFCVVFPCIFFRKALLNFWNSLKDRMLQKQAKSVCLGLLAVLAVAAGLEVLLSALQNQSFSKYRFLLFLACGVLIVLGVLCKPKKGLSIEKTFAVIALTLGLVMCISAPVTCYVWLDDEAHYQNTIYLSQGLYTNFTEADVRTIYDPLGGFTKEERSTLEEKIQQEDTADRIFCISNASTFLPTRIGYLPAALGRWLGQVLLLDFNGRFILGRIGNLIVYCALMVLAMKRLKSGKLLLALVALAPTSLFCASNYSYDPWVFAFCSVSFAYFIGELQRPEEKLNLKNAVMMLGSMILGTFPKTPYAFLLLVLLLLPKSKFKSQRQRFCWWGSVLGAGLLMLAYTYLTSFALGDPADDRSGSGAISAIGQISYILSNPKAFLLMISSFIIDYVAPHTAPSYLTLWGFLNQSSGAYVILWLIFLAALCDNMPRRENLLIEHPFIRILGLLVLLGMTVILALMMYLVFTPVGSNVIEGCQPRYLLPLLFPFYMLAYNGWFPLYPEGKGKAVAGNLILLAVSAVAVAGIWSKLILPGIG